MLYPQVREPNPWFFWEIGHSWPEGTAEETFMTPYLHHFFSLGELNNEPYSICI